MTKRIVQKNLPQHRELAKQETSSVPCCQRKAEIMEKFGCSAKEFLLTVTPAQQSVLHKNIHDCYFGCYPTLEELNATYSSKTAQAWLVPQLVDLSEYCGVKEKFTTNQLSQCSDIIASDYSYLKVSEIMLFLARFKRCCYGRFYGSVDPLVVIEALKEFCRERNVIFWERIQEEEKNKSLVSMQNACSWEVYKQKYRISATLRAIPSGAPKSQSNPRQCERKQNYEKEMYEIAKRLAENTYKCDIGTLDVMKETFRKRYGCTPEESLNAAR